MTMNNENLQAPRVAYMLWYDKDPYPLYVCHHCDNPTCMNPLHMFLGTAADNTADMYRKGRESHKGAAGIRNRNHKLTEEQVHEIKYGPRTDAKIMAAKYGVQAFQIRKIWRGSQWKHI